LTSQRKIEPNHFINKDHIVEFIYKPSRLTRRKFTRDAEHEMPVRHRMRMLSARQGREELTFFVAAQAEGQRPARTQTPLAWRENSCTSARATLAIAPCEKSNVLVISCELIKRLSSICC
jgi:hypothetical protein